ncbi:hypothetical protein [Feifania hominis]|uniref:Uncharacterized protein n=1 Tax=Feifania hominis TaxID=2763660 RepID=A0A926DEX8_9FIRM|nr:hypothetical protein [Feifania hominis]MBC8536591.1 hypothetical protein [Feifania hominis]
MAGRKKSERPLREEPTLRAYLTGPMTQANKRHADSRAPIPALYNVEELRDFSIENKK